MFGAGGVIDELVAYIKKNLKKGYTKESLKWALINQGYSKFEVEKALKRVDEELAKQAPKLNSKPIIKYEVVEPTREKVKKEGKKPEKGSFWKWLLKD